MWTLLLNRVGDPPGSYADRRQFDGGQIKIGRNARSCDWVLPDELGHISREHCTITAMGLDLYVLDTSTNGVALNGQRIVPQTPVPIRVGDRLLLGEFNIEVGTEGAGAGIALQPPALPPLPGRNSLAQADSWFDAPADPIWGREARDAEVHEFLGSAMHDFLGDPVAARGAMLPASEPAWGPMADAFAKPIMAELPPIGGDFGIPEDWAAPPRTAATEPLLPPLPAPATPAPIPPTATKQGAADWAAFCDGAGMTADDLRLSPDAMRRLGVLYRQVVLGLSDLIQDRAAFKDEFRVERTQLSMGRNNPLKHLPPLDTAKVLLGEPLPGFMASDEAVRAAFEDVKKHQLAMLAGVQHAMAAVFDRLSPVEINRLMAKAGEGKRPLPFTRGVNPWTVYQAVFEALKRDATANSNSVMSVAFREGYEKFLKSGY